MSDPTEANEPKKERGLSNLAVRLLTAAVAIPALLWMLFLAPAWVFSCFGVVAAAAGAVELAGMTLGGERLLSGWLVLATMAVTAVVVFTPSAEALLTLMVGLFVTGPLVILLRPAPLEKAGLRMGWLIAGPLYVGGAIGAIATLHHLERGGTWVVLAMALAWGSDTGGYFAGRAFGKHKLYELISPKKTIEGAIGGLAAVVAFGLVIGSQWLPGVPLWHVVVLSLLAGAVGQAGDLCVSVVKRSTGVKDSGFLIPGHGGLLDRIDALMFTAAVTLLYTHWALRLPATVPHLF